MPDRPLTAADLDAIERVWAAATPGPWRHDIEMADVPDDTVSVDVIVAADQKWVVYDARGESLAADLIAIAAAPEHVARLVAECRRLRAALTAESSCARCGSTRPLMRCVMCDD